MKLRGKRTMTGPAVVLAIVLLASPVPAETPDIAAGRAFAEENCARCHAVGSTGASKLPTAPPFRGFARNWPLENLEESLAEGIATGHPEMPEFELTTEQIDDFIAYLRTIQEK